MSKLPFTRKVACYAFRKLFRWLPDDAYLRGVFRIQMRRPLVLDNPEKFNDKLQWLKIHNREPLQHTLVDKITVKDYIAKEYGEEFVIPTLGVWDDPRQIDFDSLPEKFVVKANHSGGNLGVVVCNDRATFDSDDAVRKLRKAMSKSAWTDWREWPYKGITPRVFAEKYIGENPTDYKFFCFNGEVDSVMLCIDREKGDPKFYFFDEEWRLRRYNIRGKAAPEDFTLPAPEGIDKMFELARRLSVGHPFARVDLYNVDGSIYFGEITFYPDGGFDSNLLEETDIYFGSLTRLNS